MFAETLLGKDSAQVFAVIPLLVEHCLHVFQGWSHLITMGTTPAARGLGRGSASSR